MRERERGAKFGIFPSSSRMIRSIDRASSLVACASILPLLLRRLARTYPAMTAAERTAPAWRFEIRMPITH